ncbi:hypothetical protein [Microbacterium pygmaeum]|uniref:GyrI-like small molecule binding domain-containing protein n=1 Tax=Microbacterium pygmaeum TaxID=370764 RepID=A0A1G7YY47_9MICO|nr:hypothetical protein [Microbacterium pygmaeum]SDH01413.1 hypothetical protein SAMN04489810_1890 [Microbacterium pygmaeum]
MGDFADVTLAHVPLAATLVHHGVRAGIGDSWMTLSEWVEQNGYRFAGPYREVHLIGAARSLRQRRTLLLP